MLLSCRWKRVAEDLPAQPLTGALSISGLYDLEPAAPHAFAAGRPEAHAGRRWRRLSPAFFPRPKGKLYAAVGLDESENSCARTSLIRDVWGPTAVPVCETVPGANHFTVLNSLVDPAARLHDLALRLLGPAH
jgi:arylformamidase